MAIARPGEIPRQPEVDTREQRLQKHFGDVVRQFLHVPKKGGQPESVTVRMKTDQPTSPDRRVRSVRYSFLDGRQQRMGFFDGTEREGPNGIIFHSQGAYTNRSEDPAVLEEINRYNDDPTARRILPGVAKAVMARLAGKGGRFAKWLSDANFITGPMGIQPGFNMYAGAKDEYPELINVEMVDAIDTVFEVTPRE